MASLTKRKVIKLNIPVVTLTKGPAFHWFGYYDKFQFDPTDRFLLGMQVSFEHRLPTKDEFINIGMIDLENNNQWIRLGESRAWSWQQGAMLQWRPNSESEIIWNDRENDRFVCRVLDIKTKKLRTLPRAIGTISPNGQYALCEDFSRIWNFRPGYGYAGIPDSFANQPAPKEIGVWRMNMDTGETKQLMSLAEIIKTPYPHQQPTDFHYINHLAWNPDGNRFLFFNRWSGKGQPTRVFTMDNEGNDLRLLSAKGASHWAWRDNHHVLIWNDDAYKLFQDNGSGSPIEILWDHPNGHQTYIPGTNSEWLLTDTYPQGKNRLHMICLYHIPSKKVEPLGHFHSPLEYEGEWRCDTHPRLNRKGNKIVFDSPHEGNGRQMYMIDINQIISSSYKS